MMESRRKHASLGRGQVALELDESAIAPAEQLRDLVRISDPALSELDFDALLGELLIRVRDLLDVDTVAILLLDPEANELVARAAKGIEEEVEAGVRVPVGRGFAGRIAGERVAIFIPDVDHADILNPLLRAKGIHSLLGVPLIVEGELLGVLHVGSLEPRLFDSRDLAVLEMAAVRAGPAIERARLLGALEREHRTAVTLQRSLLPRRLETAPGLTVAARYIPARDEVGGDWYDTLELSGGRLGVAIGDVVGHGLGAAMLMGQLRTALRAYAMNDNGPGETLQLVDRFTRRLGQEAMATAAYAIIDPEAETIRFASAGHLPPVLVSADGTARSIETSVAPPLGLLGYGRCLESELPFASGDTLFLYTDGLIERPGTPLSLSIEELIGAVADARSPEDACLLAMDRLVPLRGPRDDVAVIAVQHVPVPAALELELPADPVMLSRMRQELTRWLGAHEIERDARAEITIAVSEACTNAVEHAYGPRRGRFRVRAERVGDSVEVTVTDRGRWRPPRGSGRGRGLKIMEAAMDALTLSTDADGTELKMRRDLVPA
jgi:anti-sigma regulatory factor (Ser/Thr protein kinase)/putative methionine-R-sulfoxide reductase with GAF domain